MGCSNARLLVQAPLNNEAATSGGHPSTSPQSLVSDSHNTNTTNAGSTTRMHLTGVDLVVERNGSYTLLLTPKTHKQLMPYVLRKKRFRILVDKSRTGNSGEENENKAMESPADASKLMSAATNDEEVLEQMATDEFHRAERRILGGRSIDRGNPEDDDANIESDDEGMIEEIITTVEEDKDLECKVKTKIETKKTVAQDPETHNRITKMVKTEVKEVTRTITINDSHDLERAKRELGIDDVNRYLPPTSTWNVEQTRSIEKKENQSIPLVSPSNDKSSLAEATSVGRGAVIETIPSVPIPAASTTTTKNEPKKKKKKKSKLCSCTRSVDEEEKPSTVNIVKEIPPPPPPSAAEPSVQTKATSIQGQTLISSDIKQLIIEKKQLLIDYIHSTVFGPAKLVETDDEDLKARKISSRILDLLRYDRCASWTQMLEQLQEEYLHPAGISRILPAMVQTYENLFTHKSAQLLNTFATIHQANDLTNIVEKHDYLTAVQTSPNERPIYDEEQMKKMFADLPIHKPITLAEAIAYEYIDIEEPKLALADDTVRRLKKLFRPLNEENLSNVVRVKRHGEVVADVNLEKFSEGEPLLAQLQTSFEPTLDFNEKQFRNLTETILKHKEQYEEMEFDIARTVLPLCDLKESSTNDFSQSDSGYSMTTATYESLASKIKIEFEPINQETTAKVDDLREEEKIDLDQISAEKLAELRLTPELIQIIKSDFDGTEKTVGQAILSRELRLDTNDERELKAFGIGDEQAAILSEFFFPKQTRIIAYSPSAGRFVEAQTTYHPDLPTHQIDTTIIQIQQKRSTSDERPQPAQEVEEISPHATKKEKTPPPTPIYLKKRKSTSNAGLLACFRSKKPKATTEQQGAPTIDAPIVEPTTTTTLTSKPMVDYAVLPDGRRIYIDAFRDRPGMNMSYEPVDFDQRFVLPESKSSVDYERSAVIPETESTVLKSEAIDEQIQLTHPEMVEEELPAALVPEVKVEDESAWIPLPEVKVEEVPIEKKTTVELHGASVNLPDVPLVQPGPLPRLSLSKRKKSDEKPKKSAGGLCAACFGGKSSAKRKKASVGVLIVEEKVEVPLPLPPPPVETKEDEEKIDVPTLPPVNIDVFRERTFDKTAEVTSTTRAESNWIPSTESAFTSVTPKTSPTIEKNDFTSIYANANIDNFRERDLQTGFVVKTNDEVVAEEQQKPYVTTVVVDVEPVAKEASSARQVNIDTFRERDLQTNFVAKKNDEVIVVEEQQKPHVTAVVADVEPVAKETSPGRQVNIDTFRERDLQSGFVINTTDAEVEQEKPNVTTVVADVEPVAKETSSPVGQVNIDTFRERDLQTNFVVEEQQKPNLSTAIANVEPVTREMSSVQQVNIDTFRERDLQTGAVVKTNDEVAEEETPDVTTVVADVEPVAKEVSSPVGQVNIDTFRERDLKESDEATVEEVPQPEETTPLETPTANEVELAELPAEPTIPIEETKEVIPESEPPRTPSPVVEEPHYEVPIQTAAPPVREDSAYSQVNIDVFRERTYPLTFEKPKKTAAPPPAEEPYYQEPISQPIQTAAPNADESSVYSRVNIDVFRDREYPVGTEKRAKNVEPLTTATYDIPRPVDLESSTSIVLPSISSTEKTTTAIPQIEPVKEKAKKTKKKFMTKLFGTRVPALDLPTVDQSIVLNNAPRPPHRRESDPLHIPNLHLPQPDLPLPTYDRPEVNMKTGLLPNKDEFAVPKVQLPIIQDLDLPATDNKPVRVPTDPMKIPQNDLPEVQYQTVKPQPLTIEEKYSITDTRFVETDDHASAAGRSADLPFELPPSQPIPTLTKGSIAVPPSFDDDVPSAPSKLVPAVQYSPPSTMKPIEEKTTSRVKKSSTFPLCSCFGRKSGATTTTNERRVESRSIVVPKTDLPPVDLPPPSSNVSQLLKNNDALRAPSANLPPVDFSSNATDVVRLPALSSFRSNEEKPVDSIQSVPSLDVNKTAEQWTRLKTILVDELVKNSNERKPTEELVERAVELLKEKKVDNFSELTEKLAGEEKTSPHLIEPIVRSLRYSIEKQGLDNIDKPEFPLAISDLVRQPVMSLGTTNMPKSERKSSTIETGRTCFTCNRSKKSGAPLADGLLDERRRNQLHDHRQELVETLNNQIQLNQPTVQRCVEHPKETEKILRKALLVLGQGKSSSYEQIRHELKTEHKQTFHLVDPLVDIVRDTLEHCDLAQMSSKTNVDILKSHVSQAAQLYNNEVPLLAAGEHRALKANELVWLETFLVEQEGKEKKFSRKQNKEFQRVLHRALELLSIHNVSTWEDLSLQLQREHPKSKESNDRVVQVLRQAHRDGLFGLQQAPSKRRASTLITERAKENLKTNRNQVFLSMRKFFAASIRNDDEFDLYLKKTFEYLEEQKPGQFKDYNELKEQLKKDFPSKDDNQRLLSQLVDVIEQAHACNQFEDIDKAEVQALMLDRVNGKPLVIKEMYVSLPSRLGAQGSSKNSTDDSTNVNGERTLNNGANRHLAHRVGRGLSWREANERARILFYRGKHPAIHYDEQSAAFDVRMLLETASGGTQEIPVTDSDVHELLNSCGVQWDGVNIVSLVDHSEDVVRAAEQAALKVIREKGLVDLRTPLTPSADAQGSTQ